MGWWLRLARLWLTPASTVLPWPLYDPVATRVKIAEASGAMGRITRIAVGVSALLPSTEATF
jgi:hypothetical protein